MPHLTIISNSLLFSRVKAKGANKGERGRVGPFVRSISAQSLGDEQIMYMPETTAFQAEGHRGRTSSPLEQLGNQEEVIAGEQKAKGAK